MTVTSETYIQDIDRSGATPTENEVFTVDFTYNDAAEIIVWTIDSSGVFTRQSQGTNYVVLTTTIQWVGTAPSDDMRIQRFVLFNQPREYERTTPQDLEGGMDATAIRGQLILKPDPLQPLHYSAEGDRISTVLTDPDAIDTWAVTKAKVDATFTDTTNWTIAAGDVGKFATTDTIQDLGWKWAAFNGHPSPKGQEGKYLTGAGWQEFGVIPTASGDGDKLLKDVSGVPTWTDMDEFPSGSTFGQILSQSHNSPVWRDSQYLPTPLSATKFEVVKQQSDGIRNEWRGRFFLTKEWITFDSQVPTGINNPTWNGGFLDVETGILQHEVYWASITHSHGVEPDFVFAQTDLQTMNISTDTTLKGGTPVLFNYITNITGKSSSSIDVALVSPFHEYTNAGGVHTRWFQHDTTVTVPITILWYFDS